MSTTPNLELTKPGIGSANWGVVVNDNYDLIDEGLAPAAYYRASAGSALTLNIAPGKSYRNGSVITYVGGTLSMADDATNYVYLDVSAACAPASNTTGFGGDMPIAEVTTASGVITVVTDKRTPWISRGRIRYADEFPGADAGEKIVAAIADLPATGGTVDARGLEGAQTFSALTISRNNITVLLGAGTYTQTGQLLITGDNVSIIGLGRGSTVLETSTAGTAILIDSLTWPAARINYTKLQGFTLTQTAGAPQGIGIEDRYFFMTKLNDIQITGFTNDFYLHDGSELTGWNLRAASGTIGLRAERTGPAPKDFSAVHIYDSYFHQNVQNDVVLDGVAQISFHGTDLIGTGVGAAGAVLIESTTQAVETVSFHSCTFENTAGKYAIQIGSAASTVSITTVTVDSSMFAVASNDKIIVHSKLGTLNLINSVIGGLTPDIRINATQLTEPVINIEGTRPYWAKYNVLDERSVTVKTGLYLHKSVRINPFNNDFTRGLWGYISNAAPANDAANFVTGIASLFFAQTGAEQYLEMRFYDIGARRQDIGPGTVLTVDFIIKHVGAESSVLRAYTTNLTGADPQVVVIPQPFIVQTFTNGFQRRFTEYTVPTGRLLVGFRLSNGAAMGTDFWIDYLAIHAKDVPVNHDVITNVAPTSGTWKVGNYVRNITPTSSGILGWTCITAGAPGTWVAIPVSNSSTVGWSAAAISLGGGTTIKQIKLTGNISIDPASIAATSRGTATGTFSGCAAGDAVIALGMPAINDDLIYMGADCSAADTIRIYLYNPTAGAIEDGANNWQFLWFDMT